MRGLIGSNIEEKSPVLTHCLPPKELNLVTSLGWRWSRKQP